jgi:hypothetical protein
MLLRGVDISLEPVLMPIDLNTYRKALAGTKDAN